MVETCELRVEAFAEWEIYGTLWLRCIPHAGVRMNYVPVIAEHVTCNFLVNGVARLKVLLGRRMVLGDDDARQQTCDDATMSGGDDVRPAFGEPKCSAKSGKKKSKIHLAKRNRARR